MRAADDYGNENHLWVAGLMSSKQADGGGKGRFFFFQRINDTALLECACIVIEGVDQPRRCFEVADVRLPFLLFPSLSLPLLVWDFLHNLPLIAPIRIVRRNHFAPSPSRTLLGAGRIGGVDAPVTGLKDAKL